MVTLNRFVTSPQKLNQKSSIKHPFRFLRKTILIYFLRPKNPKQKSRIKNQKSRITSSYFTLNSNICSPFNEAVKTSPIATGPTPEGVPV